MARDPGTGGYTPPKKKKKPKPYAQTVGPSDVATEAIRRHRTPFRAGPGPLEQRARGEQRARRKNARIAAARAHVEAAQNAIENLRISQTNRSELNAEPAGGYTPAFFEQAATQQQQRQAGVDPALLGIGAPEYAEGIIDKTIREFGTAAIYSPAAAFMLGKGVGFDVRDIATGRDFTPERTAEMGEQIVRQTAADIRHPLRHPGYFLFDALGIGAGVAGLGSRVSAAGSAAAEASRAGSGATRSLAEALVRPPGEGGSLLRKPPPGRTEIAPGVFKYHSKNVLAKAAQKARIRHQRKHPESRAGGGTLGRKLPERIGYERARQERIETARAQSKSEALLKQAKKASKEEQIAVRVVAEQAPINARIEVHREELAKITGKSPTAFLARKKINDRIKLLEAVKEQGLVSEKGVGKYKIEPSPKLALLVEKTERSSLRRDDILEELDLMTKAELQKAKDAPARVFAGAKYETPTPAKRGVKSEKHEAAEKRVARLEKIHEKSLERAAKKAVPYETVKVPGELRKVERPRTEAEARALVAKLDDLEEKQLKTIEEHLTGTTEKVTGAKREAMEAELKQAQLDVTFYQRAGKHAESKKAMSKMLRLQRELKETKPIGADMREVLARNRENQRKFKKSGGARAAAARRAEKRGGTVEPTENVKAELRAMAQAELDKALKSKDPEMVKLAAAMAERDRLKAELNDPERVFGGEAKPAELGKKTETKRGTRELPSALPPKGTYTPTTERIGAALSVARDDLARMEARAAKLEKQTGLVGGEGAAAGRFKVPASERRRGAAGVSAKIGRSVGVVRKKQVTHGAYTGVSTRKALDPIRAVRAVAENEQEAQRLASALRNRAYAESISIGPEEFMALSDKVRDYHTTVRVAKVSRKTGQELEAPVAYSRDTRDLLERLDKKAAEGLSMTRKEKRQLRKAGDEAVDFFFPDLGEKEALVKAAEGEVRFVDTRKLGGANRTEGQVAAWLKPLGTLTDEVNAAFQIALLFAKPAYLVPNLLGQSALAIIQQGFMAPQNMARASQIWHDLGHFNEGIEVRGEIKAGVGLDTGGLAAGGQLGGGRAIGATRDFLAHQYGKLLDSPFRWPSFIHEARKLGYSSTEDIVRLVTSKDKKTMEDANEAFQRTRDAMVDYSDMPHEFEKNVLRRMVFFYPWVKGSTVYTARFLRDHPIQAAVLAQQGRVAEEDIRKLLGPRPFYARSIFPVGKDKDGNPMVADPTAAGLFGYPAQLAEAAKQLVDKNPKAGYTLQDFLSPAFAGAVQFVSPHDPLSGYQLSTPEALKRQFFTGLPQYRLYKGITEPTDPNDLYPTSKKTAWGRYLIGGVFPHPVNVSELNSRAAEEGRSSLSPAERAYADVFAERKAVFEAAKKYAPKDLVNGRLPAPLREAFNRSAARNAALAAVEDKTDPSTQERERVKYQAEVALLSKWGVVSGKRVAATLVWAKSAKYEDLQKARETLSNTYFSKAYLDLLADVHKYLEEKGATFAAG